jgi:hypothetical protein
MPSQSEALPAVTRGEKAGRLAASEMIKTESPEIGGVQGVMRRLEAVGNILAEGHQRAGMSATDVRSWRFGFQAGVGLELGDHMQRMRAATLSPAREQIGTGPSGSAPRQAAGLVVALLRSPVLE